MDSCFDPVRVCQRNGMRHRKQILFSLCALTLLACAPSNQRLVTQTPNIYQGNGQGQQFLVRSKGLYFLIEYYGWDLSTSPRPPLLNGLLNEADTTWVAGGPLEATARPSAPVDELREAARRHPNNIAAHKSLWHELYYEGEYTEAAGEFREAARLEARQLMANEKKAVESGDEHIGSADLEIDRWLVVYTQNGPTKPDHIELLPTASKFEVGYLNDPYRITIEFEAVYGHKYGLEYFTWTPWTPNKTPTRILLLQLCVRDRTLGLLVECEWRPMHAYDLRS
jgi:hypothetical protein